MVAFDSIFLALIVIAYCIQRCRLDARRSACLKAYPFNKYKSGLMALVQYSEKNEGAADIKKVTAAEYAHQVMKKEYFEVPVPRDWAE